MFEEGRSMDESSTIQIPLSLFDHLDNPEINNPELFQVMMIEEAENRASKLKEKIQSLDVSDLHSFTSLNIIYYLCFLSHFPQIIYV